jgi:molecular chaperone HscA
MYPIQVSEPGLISQDEVVFGIDLGTTNSLIAMVDKYGNAEIIKDEKGREILPSVLLYDSDGISVGHEVDLYSPRAVCSIKRLMGKSVSDLNEDARSFEIDHESEKIIRVKCADEKYLTPVELSAEILIALCKRVKKSTGLTVKKAVITVPAYFDDSARNATKYAAQLAGIKVLRLINEPTAAALAYSIAKNNNSGIYAVYDLGGGTFDISILKLHNGVFQVLAVGGDTKLGGDDFDYLLGSIVTNKLTEKVDNIPLVKSRLLKEHLSANNVNRDCQCEITREEFEQSITPLVDKTINTVISTLEDVALNINDINGIILVGGATKVPLIKNSLVKLFGNKVLDDIDPYKTVAIGAALQAHYLTSSAQNRNIMLDVLPLSLGIETMGGIVEKIIPRNTPLPISEVKEFTTYANGQTAIKINVCQGEREMIRDNKSLAQFELKNIPPLPAGSARIAIEFTVGVDGILTVTAREKTTGIEQTITVDSSMGLSEADIENMVSCSIEKFEQDIKARSLAEAKLTVEKLIDFIGSNNTELIEKARTVLQSENLDDINSIIVKLEQELTN